MKVIAIYPITPLRDGELSDEWARKQTELVGVHPVV